MPHRTPLLSPTQGLEQGERREDGGCTAVAAEAEAGARVTKSQGSWAQRGQLLLGFRCPRRRRGRTGMGGHRPAPGSTRPRGRRATYRRGGGAARGPWLGRLCLGVPGEVVLGLCRCSPLAAGQVPRGGPRGNGSEQSPGGAGASGATGAALSGARKPEPAPREGTRLGTCAEGAGDGHSVAPPLPPALCHPALARSPLGTRGNETIPCPAGNPDGSPTP